MKVTYKKLKEMNPVNLGQPQPIKWQPDLPTTENYHLLWAIKCPQCRWPTYLETEKDGFRVLCAMRTLNGVEHCKAEPTAKYRLSADAIREWTLRSALSKLT